MLLDEGPSSGGTEGSILSHIAFRVQSLETVAEAGLELESLGSFSGIANVYSPEGERIELFDDTATTSRSRDDGGADPGSARRNRLLDGPVRSHHLHLYLVDDAVEEAQRWYATTFGGVPGMRRQYDAVDLPGINFNFSFNPYAGGAPTAGRILDHIGFEVDNLERFSRDLEAPGVALEFVGAVISMPSRTIVVSAPVQSRGQQPSCRERTAQRMPAVARAPVRPYRETCRPLYLTAAYPTCSVQVPQIAA